MSLSAVTPHRARLGEGPFWDAPTQALYWVDIAARQALRLMGGSCRCGNCLSTSRRSSPVKAVMRW